VSVLLDHFNLNKKGAGVCQCPYLNTTKLDNLVVSKIRGHVLTPVNLSELARLVADELNSKNIEYEAEIDPLRAEIAVCKRKLERLYDVVEEGKVSIDDLAPRIKERKDQLEKLLARIADLERALASDKAEAASEEEMIECAKDLKGLLDKGSISERRSFIRSFVKEIKVTGDEARLSYTLPMFPSGKAEELVPVLGIEQHGGR